MRRQLSAAATALLDSMVGEACAYVQGESLKAHAAFLVSAFQLPDRQRRGCDMALVKCRECGKEISSQAKACPHCGAKQINKIAVGCGALVGIALLAIVIIPILTESPTKSNIGGSDQSARSTTEGTAPDDDLSVLIPNCEQLMKDSPGFFQWHQLTCEDDIFQKVWLRFFADNGEETKLDTHQMQYLPQGGVSVIIYTFVPNTSFDPNRLRRVYLDCAGHVQDVESNIISDAPPKSVIGHIADKVCRDHQN